MPAGCPRKWILYSITEHPLRIICTVHPLLGASGNGSKIKLRAYLVISGLKEKLAGAATAPGLILPQVSPTHENCLISKTTEQIMMSYIAPLVVCQDT